MTRNTRRVDYWQDPHAPRPTSRKASASAFVRDEQGRLLRADNDLWTIPTGGIKKGETVSECAIRECLEETGVQIKITGLVGIFSSPDHVIAYLKNGKIDEVRQPINVCLRADPIGGDLRPNPREAREARWVDRAEIDRHPIHPAIMRRIHHGLHDHVAHID